MYPKMNIYWSSLVWFLPHTSYNGDGLMLENIYGNTQSTESANLISFQLDFDFFELGMNDTPDTQY